MGSFLMLEYQKSLAAHTPSRLRVSSLSCRYFANSSATAFG
jgi:hypothetical protein